MKLSQAKLGDKVRLFTNNEGEVCKTPTDNREVCATIIGSMHPSKVLILLGRMNPQTGFSKRDGTKSKTITYLDGHEKFGWGLLISSDTEIVEIVSSSSVSSECPCGIFRGDCDYHKP